jgi:hypothetical protein
MARALDPTMAHCAKRANLLENRSRPRGWAIGFFGGFSARIIVTRPLINISVSCADRQLVGDASCFSGNPGVRMTSSASRSQEDIGVAALALLEQALELLDQFDAPIESAALVDLAIHRLRDSLAAAGADRSRSRRAE